MILPPLSMWLDVASPGHRRVRLWLPLFLVWLLLVPLALLALVLAIVADLVLLLAGRPYHHYTLLLLGCFAVLAATRGTVVRVNGDDAVVDLAIY
jgi:uncharacterized membrane protein